jgi:hypothetical protein
MSTSLICERSFELARRLVPDLQSNGVHRIFGAARGRATDPRGDIGAGQCQ